MKKKIILSNAIIHDEIDDFIKEICETHDTEDIEQDIIALFEDIIKFFSGREDEFIKLKDMPPEAQKEIHDEIKAIIAMLRGMGKNTNKQEILSILSKSLINKFSSKKKGKYAAKEFDKAHQQQIKEMFAKLTLHELHIQSMELSKARSEDSLSNVKSSYQNFVQTESGKNHFTDKELLSKVKNKTKPRFIG